MIISLTGVNFHTSSQFPRTYFFQVWILIGNHTLMKVLSLGQSSTWNIILHFIPEPICHQCLWDTLKASLCISMSLLHWLHTLSHLKHVVSQVVVSTSSRRWKRQILSWLMIPGAIERVVFHLDIQDWHIQPSFHLSSRLLVVRCYFLLIIEEMLVVLDIGNNELIIV